MEEIVRQVLAAVRGMWMFRWPGLIVAWVVGVAGALVVMNIPDQYEASARIYVDTQSILKPLMSGLTVQPNVEQQIAMLSRTLLSRPNMEKLVRMADLDLKANSRQDQEGLILRLTKDIQINNTGRDNLYTLNYRDSDRDRAKRVIQSLVSIFVESSLGASRKDTDSAKNFLDDQIKQYEAKLEAAETRMKDFRIRNLSLEGANGKDATARVADVAAQLQQAQLELQEAQQSRDAVKQQLEQASKPGGGFGGAASAPDPASIPVATPEIDARIDAQKRTLDSLEQRFTDQHPDVIATRRLIKQLEAQKAKEVAALRKAALAAPAQGGDASNPFTQELGSLLASSEAQVAALKARVAAFQGRLAQARADLKTAPEIEAEAAQLNRDYDITKKNYQDLVARKQAAVMSGDLEGASGVADFRLIDPPRVTPQPVAPNRLLLLPLSLLAGLAAGLGLSFVLSQLRPVFREGSELRAVTGLPLLGVVSLVVSDIDRRRERLGRLRFFGASGGLVGLYVLGMAAVAILARRGA
ncbi:MAG: chain length-determining protein [Burkholderiales bacterium]|nr:chain length-determining protein [Burkholderiales bacterium]